MSLFLRGADTFYAFRFLRLLTTQWEDTGAFKAGLIDKDGKVIKKAETSEEKAVYNIFHRLVFNVKRLINKVPLGKTTIASYLAALYLIKEHTSLTDDELRDILTEAVGAELPALTESTITTLEPGIYEMVADAEHPMTGAALFKKGSSVLVEDSIEPHGYIFGQPIFEVTHLTTQTKIKVSLTDLTQ